MNSPPKISVAMTVYNAEPFIGDCIKSLLSQSFRDFELVISDDNSVDMTRTIIRSFKDFRIKLIENEKRNYIPESRNIALKAARGKYVFFTDADCSVNRCWLENGLRILENEDVVGVWGRTMYENPVPSIEDRITFFDETSNSYATCNIAYIREHLAAVGYFDPVFKYGREDTDIAMRLLKIGKIKYLSDMIVIHRSRPWKFSRLVEYDDHYPDSEVVFLKRYPEYPSGVLIGTFRILYPKVLLGIFFPFLFLFYYRINCARHLFLLPLRWIKFIIQRYILIKAAIREKVLIC
jgi:glycosyltransferase involved in cell wall biosynthesis